MRKLEQRVEERRRQLVVRANELRGESINLVAGFAPLLRPAEKAVVAVEWLRGHLPVVVAAMVATLLIRRPRRIMGLAARAWSLWQFYRNFRAKFDLFVQRAGQSR